MGVLDIEVTYDLDLLRRTLQDNPANSKIKVTSLNGKVLISGIAPDGPAMQRVMALAEQLAPHDVSNGMKSPRRSRSCLRFASSKRPAIWIAAWASTGRRPQRTLPPRPG